MTMFVKVTEVIDAPIGEVWAITSSFGCVKLWAPYVVSSSIEGFGIGCVRTMFEWSTESEWIEPSYLPELRKGLEATYRNNIKSLQGLLSKGKQN
ncbi:hypothetical protein HRG_012475 [Hirsutella rhossiliensis]